MSNIKTFVESYVQKIDYFLEKLKHCSTIEEISKNFNNPKMLKNQRPKNSKRDKIKNIRWTCVITRIQSIVTKYCFLTRSERKASLSD